jgi:hypothetical protein
MFLKGSVSKSQNLMMFSFCGASFLLRISLSFCYSSVYFFDSCSEGGCKSFLRAAIDSEDVTLFYVVESLVESKGLLERMSFLDSGSWGCFMLKPKYYRLN